MHAFKLHLTNQKCLVRIPLDIRTRHHRTTNSVYNPHSAHIPAPIGTLYHRLRIVYRICKPIFRLIRRRHMQRAHGRYFPFGNILTFIMIQLESFNSLKLQWNLRIDMKLLVRHNRSHRPQIQVGIRICYAIHFLPIHIDHLYGNYFPRRTALI